MTVMPTSRPSAWLVDIPDAPNTMNPSANTTVVASSALPTERNADWTDSEGNSPFFLAPTYLVMKWIVSSTMMPNAIAVTTEAATPTSPTA